MVITKDNIVKVPEKEQKLLTALLEDLGEINSKLNKELQIIWIDDDNYDGIERPSFNGYYRLKFKDSYENIGIESTINGLDSTLCSIYEFVDQYLPNG